MKIAINCIFFQPKAGGIKEYIQNLVNNVTTLDIDNSYVIYVLEDQYEYARKEFPSHIKIKRVPYSSNGLFNKLKRAICESFFWKNEELSERFDLFHSPFFHSPRFKNAKVVLTVHDMRFYRFPETYELLRYLYLRHVVPRSIAKCDHIITISDFTKGEIMDAYKINPDKITTIHEAINREKFYPQKSVMYSDGVTEMLKQGDFILSVSHIEPRKNYARLVESYKRLKEDKEYKDVKLVIVGQPTPDCKKDLQLFDKTDGVIYLNFVKFELLMWLYDSAKLFVFPSYYEGFGFPPLEAGAVGCVAAVSNVSVMPEVCGDGVFYFDPFDISDMTNVIKEALTNEAEREDKRLRMRDVLDRYSWRKNAEETIKLYNMLK